MKHLTIVTDAWTPQINGVVTTMQIVEEEARARGWDVTVIHPGMFKTCTLPVYKEIEVVINPWELGKFIQHTNSIHIVTEGPLGWAARFLCMTKKWAYTTGFHTNFPEYLNVSYNIPTVLTYPIFRWFHKNSRAVFVPSQTTADKLRKLSFKNMVIWSRGYRANIFNPSRKRTDLLSADKINLVYVGRVSKEKNIDAFLALKDDPRFALWVVGDGPDRERLEALQCATFVGFKTGIELAEYFASADVFVFPSKTDTLGIVSIEAMACGTPVAAFDVEGPRDVIIQGEGGFVHDDLKIAVHKALDLRGNKSVLQNAELNTWSKTADIFLQNIVTLQGNKF